MEEKIHALSDNQFDRFLMENPGFKHRNYKLWEKEGDYDGVLVLKKWGHNKNIVAYVELKTGECLICCAYQDADYLGLPDIILGSLIRLTFGASKTGKNRLTAVTLLSEKPNDLSERYKSAPVVTTEERKPVGKIYTWDDFPKEIEPKDYHLNRTYEKIEGVLVARRYGESNNIIAYVNPDPTGTKKVNGTKASAFADDNDYLGLPYIAEGTNVRLIYSISGRYSRLDAIEVID